MQDNNYNFFEDVIEITRQVPAGRVTTYGAIARYLGTAQSARMVGWALNQSFKQPNVPAHRVVNRNGMLSGKMHFETPRKMQELLESEGVQVIQDQVVNFCEIFWDPVQELQL